MFSLTVTRKILLESTRTPLTLPCNCYKYPLLLILFSYSVIELKTTRAKNLIQKLYIGYNTATTFLQFMMSMIPSFFGNRRSSFFDPFSLDVWDPLKDLPFPSPSFPHDGNSVFVNTRIDWKETPEAHVFKADLPGLRKEEVKVQIEDDRVLQISGERNVEKEDKNDTWHRVERSSGKFMRRFRLPENTKMNQVKASMENGVLTVTVPKEEAVKKPGVKNIEISG